MKVDEVVKIVNVVTVNCDSCKDFIRGDFKYDCS